jgi:flagellar hook-associated protein 1 FlgK
VAQLNQGIVAGDSAGQNVNALSDERRSAVDQLAGLLGISTSTAPSGALTINSGGVQLVSGNVAETLMSTGSAATENLGIATSSGIALQPSGSIGADLTAVNSTLPGYQTQLSAVANALAGNLNTLQANGMDANGDPGGAIAGGYTGTVLPNIFVDQGSASSYTPSTMSAATIAVSSAYLADPSLIATAAAPGPSNSNVIGQATLDSANAQAMAALAGSTTGPDTFYQSLIGTLGTEAANASGTSTAASNLATTASSNLASISGVNQNQQEVDILSAQNAFQAASQAIDAINQSFQSLLQAV